MQRSAAPELLDGPLPDAAVLRGNLRDLARVNRWLGGVDLSARAIDHLLGDRPEASVLDVGTGAADIPLALLGRAAHRGRALTVTGIETRPEILAAAAERDPRLRTERGLRLETGDGRSLPYPDRSFDVTHASLVVHHLAPDEAVRLLAEMRRVARVGVVINDLARGRLAYAGAWTLTRIATRNPFTRHDAPLSVRRAYTMAELDGLLAGAGLHADRRWSAVARHRWAVACRVQR